MAAPVKAKERHQNDIYISRIDVIVMHRLADLPSIILQLSVASVSNTFEFAGFPDPRYCSNDRWKIRPYTLKGRVGIDLAKSFDADETVNCFDLCQIKAVEEIGGDLCARVVALIRTDGLAFCQEQFPKFRLGHRMLIRASCSDAVC